VRRIGIATILLLSCKVGDTYRCTRDSECVLAEDQGWCESSGYCSFRDASCSGGRRYGRWAPPPFGSSCVGDAEVSTDMTTSDQNGCGGDLQPCCNGSCDGGRICGNGTCFFFYDGFDGSISPSWTMKADNGCTIVADTSKAYRGTGSLKITANAGAVAWEQAELLRPMSLSPLYARAYVWIPSTAAFSLSDPVQLITYRDGANSPYPQAVLTLSSTFRLGAAVQNWTSTPASVTASAAIPLETWVCVEWRVQFDGSASVRSFQDGSLVASIAPMPLGAPLNAWYFGFAGPPPASTVTFWMDELAFDANPIGCQR
jgi:hypothetical protein